MYNNLTAQSTPLHMYTAHPNKWRQIKTHGSELRNQGGSTLQRTHVSILQEQTLLT